MAKKDIRCCREKDNELSLHSWLTSGTFAIVYIWKNGHYHIQKLLIDSYLNGITSEEMVECINDFLANEKIDNFFKEIKELATTKGISLEKVEIKDTIYFYPKV